MKKIIVFLFLGLTFSSCGRLLFETLYNTKEVKPDVFYNPKKDKTIIGLPMVHIAKPVFYEEAKKILDSLRAEGFVVFYEGVKLDTLKYKGEELDTLYRKFRKLIGAHVYSGFDDPTNKELPRFFFNDKYIAQSNSLLGIENEDVNVDLTADRIIELYEKRYGEIKLDECDFNTPLKAKYKCERLNSHAALHGFRDDFIAEKAMDSPHKKIVMVYGKSHFVFSFRGIFPQNGYNWIRD